MKKIEDDKYWRKENLAAAAPCLNVLIRLEQSYCKLRTRVNRLTDLAYYSAVDKLPRTDKVFVNELCRERYGRAADTRGESELL
ncbi:MAG: hypothetical protein IJ618_07425 [Prevotella sp.]|nr:hypothetical protein [Prevotella sp.]